MKRRRQDYALESERGGLNHTFQALAVRQDGAGLL